MITFVLILLAVFLPLTGTLWIREVIRMRIARMDVVTWQQFEDEHGEVEWKVFRN